MHSSREVTGLNKDEVAGLLGFTPGSDGYQYVEELAAITPGDIKPLSAEDAGTICAELGLGEEETADVLSTLPDPDETPSWWWCFERAVSRLLANLGDPDAPRGHWPAFEGPAHDLERRCHFLHVALAVAPTTMRYYEALGVPPGLARAALNDVARHAAIHRSVHGLTGMEAAWWVTLCLRGEIVDLGRLQYNRFTLGVGPESPPWYGDEEAATLGPGFRRGDACLGIHIPGGSPLDSQSVDESLALAARFFETYFPTSHRRLATCLSWLLDPQLAEYLGEGSNIISFQRRFELVPAVWPGDEDVLQFVFRVPDLEHVDLAKLPQRTTMERAAVRHLRDGRHFFVRTGWLDLPADPGPRTLSLA